MLLLKLQQNHLSMFVGDSLRMNLLKALQMGQSQESLLGVVLQVFSQPLPVLEDQTPKTSFILMMLQIQPNLYLVVAGVSLMR